MRHWHIHPRFELLLAREAQNLEAIATLAGIETARFPYRKTRQGGKESTKVFNLVMRAILSLVVPTWQSSSWRVHIQEFGLLTHLVWADNVILYATSKDMLTSILQQLTESTHRFNLQWKPSSLETLTTESSHGIETIE